MDNYNEKNLMPAVKCGGEFVMFWGCLSAQGPGGLVRIHGIINGRRFWNENMAALP